VPGWWGLAALTFLYGTAFTIMFTVLPKLGVVGNSAIMNVEPVFASGAGLGHPGPDDCAGAGGGGAGGGVHRGVAGDEEAVRGGGDCKRAIAAARFKLIFDGFRLNGRNSDIVKVAVARRINSSGRPAS
jgi:hypothetical protein